MFEGAQLAEYHEHVYDSEGRLVKTVVYREAEWSEEDRARAEALRAWDDQWDNETNMPLAKAYDPQQAYMVHKGKNYAKANKERIMRIDREKHKDDKPGPQGHLWDDGLQYWVEPVDTPEDAMPVRERAARTIRERRMIRDAD